MIVKLVAVLFKIPRLYFLGKKSDLVLFVIDILKISRDSVFLSRNFQGHLIQEDLLLKFQGYCIAICHLIFKECLG